MSISAKWNLMLAFLSESLQGRFGSLHESLLMLTSSMDACSEGFEASDVSTTWGFLQVCGVCPRNPAGKYLSSAKW